uniref:GST C-terminal domain-containing protein n=1 Tax=Oryzias sinensis TaxID=183150 RepID=A0A8C8DJ73_9TELE
AALNDYLSGRSYLAGFSPSQADLTAFRLLHRPPEPQHVHALRWYRHIQLQPELSFVQFSWHFKGAAGSVRSASHVKNSLVMSLYLSAETCRADSRKRHAGRLQ